jgi:hypothetical protein
LLGHLALSPCYSIRIKHLDSPGAVCSEHCSEQLVEVQTQGVILLPDPCLAGMNAV